MAQKPAELDPQELARFAARLGEHMKELEASVDQWREYRDDYQQLGDLLSTLPDKTSYDIMVPLGKLAYMPGKLVHTNEVLALLGDNWFTEASAKHAAEIVARRQKVVEENLKVVETQLNETNARAGVTPGVFKAEQYGMNEQGEPFMEIREELPDDDQDANEPAATAPNSVEAARKLQNKTKSKAEELADQALLEKLKALELEEEGELSDEEQEVAEPDEDEDEQLSGDEYDTEIAENMFDHFDDDEEYGMDGVVDGEDFSYHETDAQEADDDAQDILETMDTIVTPSVQHEMHYNATQPSPTIAEPSPLESVVKERTTSDAPQAPDSAKNKGKTKVAPIIKPRVSRFKKSVQEQQQSQDGDIKSPRKKVSWGPDIIHEAEEPQAAANIPTEPVYNIRSPADIYHQLLDQRLAEQANEDEWSQNVATDMQNLIKDASTMKETIYMPSDRDIPQVTAAPKKKVSRFKQQRDQDKSGDPPVTSPTARPPTKLDTSVMRGAVVEKETEDVDMDEVDDNMLEKEVAAEYQRKRQNLIASQGGLTFANKPEFQVYDDDLPLPSNQANNSSSSSNDQQQSGKPKKISKFKAAKLAAAGQGSPQT
ncbi:hypothetical protein INT43_001694 [Umbelopsis isabellina]|uniref:DUF3835 domain-containing protein n=1 Tax=Mortierella isabellina TaxID=91625 RepID=A0A8H7PRH0_MORIS|nr:hypothetical protein INT43_001694 [Umbelopsis isabellina]